MKEKTYKIQCFSSSGKEIQTTMSPMWYGLTEEQARFVAIGISVGLKAKYKKARVEVCERQECDGKNFFANAFTIR